MRNTILALIAALLCGCGPMLGGGIGGPPVEVREYAMEGTKLITPGITDGRDEQTWGQPEYELSTDRRLLLRFKDLLSHEPRIRTDAPNKVELQLTLVGDPDPAAAKEFLLACPMTRQWMMAATWDYYSPYSAWKQSGGDHDSAGCFKAYKSEDKTLYFDATRWFIDYPRGRKSNHGLMLKALVPIRVVGDASGSFSPRLKWNQ